MVSVHFVVAAGCFRGEFACLWSDGKFSLRSSLARCARACILRAALATMGAQAARSPLASIVGFAALVAAEPAFLCSAAP